MCVPETRPGQNPPRDDAVAIALYRAEYILEHMLGTLGFSCSYAVRGARCRVNSAYIRQSGPQGWLALGGVPREQKMLKGHQPRAIYHQAY